MANRQARREQRRAARGTRRTGGGGGSSGPSRRPSPAGGGPQRSGGGSNLPGWLMQPFSLVVGGAVIVGVVVIALILAFGSGDEADADLVDSLEAHQIPAEMTDGTKLGADDAPIKLVMFEDFQCPFCLNFTAMSEPDLVEEYVTSGLVQLEFRHLPVLGDESIQAALATECAADQDRFWQYHNELFLIQAEAGQVSNEELNVGRFSIDNLNRIASEIDGIDADIFETCLESRQHLDAVESDRSEATSLGITGTPGFLINGQPLTGGAPANMDGWRTLLDGVLDQIENGTPTPTPGEGTPTVAEEEEPTAAETPDGDGEEE